MQVSGDGEALDRLLSGASWRGPYDSDHPVRRRLVV
jgi:hypothetical protein